ncbi:MAG: BsuPI-related putative proteinase inhibitor, partial [Thermoproteota archaeon]
LYMNRPHTILRYERHGGIAGISEVLEIADDGTFKLTRSYGVTVEGKLDPKVFKIVWSIAEKLKDFSVQPKSNAVDFFEYELSFGPSGKGVMMRWVDEFAASEELPLYVVDIESVMNAVISTLINSSFVNFRINSSNGVQVEVLLDKFFYKRNEIELYIRVRNTGNTSIEYASPTPCHPDFRVSLLEVEKGYQVKFKKPYFSDETVCIQVIDTRSIAPNDEKVNEAQILITSKLAPGLYHIRVRFPYSSEEPLVEVTIPFLLEG